MDDIVHVFSLLADRIVNERPARRSSIRQRNPHNNRDRGGRRLISFTHLLT